MKKMAKTLSEFITELSQNAELLKECEENLEKTMDNYGLDEEGKKLMRKGDPIAIKRAIGLGDSEDLPKFHMPIFFNPE
jgi:hypothetical protein